MPSPLPTDRGEYRRRRRHAWVWTVAGILVLSDFAVTLLHYALADDPQERVTGAFAFFLCALVLIVVGTGLAAVWRHTWRARPHQVPEGAAPGMAAGVFELDLPPEDHIGLSGQVDPPRRW
ncbi:hypothetical protein [Cellulomonas soli]|uniref:Uncharacterized protein n=1 Tax=Cellulomonas soli TaxID=931535 RepID=A0A512PA58_9CELL|nr:hypothetical protein [Cellulomonas soli]NYI60583.1 putative membrane protein [Cellulomonas soli]GEP68098.1 hypothetical protein CSO01_08130 [Cellulomonas soli]